MMKIQRNIIKHMQVEDAIKKEKVFTESALNSLQDVLYIFDLNGKFLRWNTSLSVVTGYSDEEISTKKPTDFFLGEDIQKISNAIEIVAKNGTARVEAKLVTKNRERIDYEFTGTLLNDVDGKPSGICKVGRDITERKRMELEYKTILHSAMDGFCVVDSQGGFLDANDSYCSMIGYGREELLKMKIKDIEAIDTEEMIVERIHRIFKVGKERFETRHKCKDGRIVDIEVTVNYNEAGSGKFFLFIRDITERKQMETALSKSEENFQSIFELSADLICIADISGYFRLINKAFERTLGYSKKELLGEPFLKFVHPEDREKTLQVIEEKLKLGKTVISFENRFVRKDGGTVWLEWTSQPMPEDSESRTIAIARDITGRRLIEDKLKKSKEFSETVFNNMNDAISIIDVNDFRIIDVNSIFLKIYGLKKEDVIGKTCYEITHKRANPCNSPDEVCPLLYTLETGKHSAAEHVHYVENGEKRNVEVATSPISDEKGKIINVIHVARDITERKRAEQIYVENIRLAAADHAKSEFLANMSHELRTPLNASIGFSELLKEGRSGELTEKQKHYVNNILLSNQFLLTLINDILDLSKIEAGKIQLAPEKMSVPAAIQETLSLIKEKATKHNMLLKTEFDPEVEFIEADKQRFKQILFNLLSNAVKFSKETGGTLTIKAKKEADMVKISVSDTGIGIKDENIGRLFQKFEQLDSGISQKYGGTGLGLSITKQLVELHGGKIWAESQFGECTTFTFLLPILAKIDEKQMKNVLVENQRAINTYIDCRRIQN
jgi:PAS domain S-box-containing protein